MNSPLRKQLRQSFQQLAAILLIDPEDLQDNILELHFKQALSEHDFFYDYSDDHSVWQRGREEEAILQAALKLSPDLAPIWADYVAAKAIFNGTMK